MKNKVGIGIVAFSNSLEIINEKLIPIGTSKLESLGFTVKFGKNVCKKEDYTNIAGTIEERISDLNEFLVDDSIDLIMAVIGGHNSNQLLSYLDYNLIKKSNKKIIGFSDTTALLNAIFTKTGIPTFLGPSFVSFCNPSITSEVETCFFDVVMENKKEITYNAPSKFAYDDWYLKEEFGPRDWRDHPGHKFIRKGYADSIVVGGNCQTLLKLAGTDFFPDVKDKILILEDVPNQPPAVFVSELAQLKDMGVFDKISGLIIGQFGYDNRFYKSGDFAYKILEICQNTTFPILINVNFSHVDPLFTVKIGGRLIMDSEENILKLVN